MWQQWQEQPATVVRQRAQSCTSQWWVLGLGLGARSGSIWWVAGLIVGMQSKRVLLTEQFKNALRL